MSRVFQYIKNLVQRLKIWIELNKKSIAGWLELEGYISYRFPVIESIIGMLLIITVITILTGSLGFWKLTLHQEEGNQLVASSDDIGYADSSPLLSIPLSFVFPLVILIPLLVSYTTARGFETDTTKTFLSYPISRFQFLMLKTLSGICITGCISTLSIIFGSFVVGRFMTQLSILMAIIIGIWVLIIFIVSMTTFYAILLKSSIATSFLGIGTFFLATISYIQLGWLKGYAYFPDSIRGILNPLLLVHEHLVRLYFDSPLLPPSFEDVMISITLCLIISTLVFVLTWKIFEHSEVK